MAIFPIDEIKRKVFHILTIFYIAAYWFLPLRTVLWGLGILIAAVIVGEVIRLNVPGFNVWILKILGGVHRESETNRLSGMTWTLSGSFLTMLVFPDRRIVLASLLYLALGDAVAALFGRRFGKHKILGEKSLEGSLACLIACLVIGLVLLDWKLAVLGAFIVTIIELIPWPLNDNFWMPLLSALSLTFITRLILP